MSSNYPLPQSTASVLAGDGSAPSLEQQPIERVSRPSPQPGQGPPPPQYHQSSQELSASPQQPAPSHHFNNQIPHNHSDSGHGSTSQEIEAAAEAAAAAIAATAHHGLAALQEATDQQQHQAAPTSQYPLPPQPMPTPVNAGIHYQTPVDNGAQSPRKNSTGPKAMRLRRACDMCSARKVKCDEGPPPCKPCKDLGVECTNLREMKRRGPPNKHAEAARNKRPRLEPSFAPNLQPVPRQLQGQLQQQQLQPPATMSPHPQNAAATLVSIASNGPGAALDGESIAPWQVLELLVDDFFTYIHPLAPFPHEPTFKHQFNQRMDRTSPEFLALLASMIGCLVASFPRSARLHLKNQGKSNLFPRAITMIERCRAVALEARGPHFMSKEDVTVYDAATSYFLGLAAGYTMQWKLCRRFMTETLSFIRELGFHKPTSALGIMYRGPPIDHINDQIGKRIFWVMFLGVRSMSQLGVLHSEIVLPAFTLSEPRPDYPVEVDDQYILQHQILGQPEGTVSLLTGFVRVVKIYETMNPVVSVELAYGLATLPWYEQRSVLFSCLTDAKNAVENMPPELYLDMDTPPVGQIGSTEVFQDAPGYHYHPPAYPQPQPLTDIRRVLDSNPIRRRQLQYEIQKANIYASQLATRSHYVERYLNLRDSSRGDADPNGYGLNGTHTGADGNSSYEHDKNVAAAAVHAAASQADDAIDTAMKDERELIVKNLLVVITSLPQQNMEPNGASLINKIRQVASTLLNDAPGRKGPLAKKNEEYLARFLGILTRLEKTVPANAGLGVVAGGGMGDYHGTTAMTAQDEEDELRNWADLREHQLRFASQGGFLMGP